MAEMMRLLAPILFALTAIGLLTAIILRGGAFRLYHLWVTTPFIGRIARFSRLGMPSRQEAEKHLDRLFRGYYKRIGGPLTSSIFANASKYLFLSGDAATHPANAWSWIRLVLLLTAESLAFSFVLGGTLWADASDDLVKLFALLITLTVVVLLAYFGHLIGRIIRHHQALVVAGRFAIDRNDPIEGEEMHKLLRPVSLDDDQQIDHPKTMAPGPQRMLNRCARFPGDTGRIWPAYVYAIGVLLLAGLQYELRAISNIATSAATLLPFEIAPSLPTAPDASMAVANIFFVAIFVATQIYAVSEGMAHRFLGLESVRAYHRKRGFSDFEGWKSYYDARVNAANEALIELLAAYQRRYNLKPDPALYHERANRDRAMAAKVQDDPGTPPGTPFESDPAVASITPSPATAGANVTVLPIGGGAK